LANGFQPKDLQLMMRCFIDVSAMAMAVLALPVTAMPEYSRNWRSTAKSEHYRPGTRDRNLNCLPLKAQRLAATERNWWLLEWRKCTLPQFVG